MVRMEKMSTLNKTRDELINENRDLQIENQKLRRVLKQIRQDINDTINREYQIRGGNKK
jgi:regulator of replication initiation timing